MHHVQCGDLEHTLHAVCKASLGHTLHMVHGTSPGCMLYRVYGARLWASSDPQTGPKLLTLPMEHDEFDTPALCSYKAGSTSPAMLSNESVC